MEGSGGRALRAKYFDWCSARVAERFLDLTPEEIYELARPDEGAEGTQPGQRSPIYMDESYRAQVQRATEALLSRMSLPTFDVWARDYEASPERYEAELLGFWKDVSAGGE